MTLAYFLTFTTYGTWLHGAFKGVGSVDRKHNEYGEDFVEPDPVRESYERSIMTDPMFALDQPQRALVLNAMIELSKEKGWDLHAAHVRTTHVHVVISAEREPGRLMSDLKARASRDLTRAGFGDSTQRRWTRHGSTLHLFNEQSIEEKIHYTLFEQGKPMAMFDGTNVTLK